MQMAALCRQTFLCHHAACEPDIILVGSKQSVSQDDLSHESLSTCASSHDGSDLLEDARQGQGPFSLNAFKACPLSSLNGKVQQSSTSRNHAPGVGMAVQAFDM